MLALAAASSARAQVPVPPPSVETYADQGDPAFLGEGVLPDGVVWNQPVKAGSMVLPRASAKGKAQQKTKEKTPSVAGGGIQAPQMSLQTDKANATEKARAPQISAGKGSTGGMMLLQGMKTALQKSGQNTDIPKSDLTPVETAAAGPKETDKKEAEVSLPALPPVPSKEPMAEKGGAGVPSDVAARAVPLAAGAADFVAGQGPKGWVPPAGAAAVAEAKESTKGDGWMDITFPPEMAASPSADASADLAPKATELTQAPALLEELGDSLAPPASVVAKTAKKEEEKSLFDRMAEPFTSIFGEPVDEKAEKESARKDGLSGDLASPLDNKALTPACEPRVEKWTRSCADAGYPAHFVGQIVGETRVVCPLGDARDVWLSNDCAAPIASAPMTAQAAPDPPPATPSVRDPSVREESAVVVDTARGAAVDDAAIDAVCGASNGLASEGKPAADLCLRGAAGPVMGEGPWRWTCRGIAGGMTVSCAAPVASGRSIAAKDGPALPTAQQAASLIEDGACGGASGVGTDNAPVADLCKKGTPSRVNGDGPWTWACGGANGGVAASCLAPRKADGACGPASGSGADTMPMQGLCADGYASAVTGQGPWNWTCSGLHGGAPAVCAAPLKANAVCGAASMKGHAVAPSVDLCSVGSADAVGGDGPWTWVCAGSDGGASVSCKALPLLDGVCGSAHGSQYERPPSQGLCASGEATRVVGEGPFLWSCVGENGGSTASCVAALGTRESMASIVACGEAAEAAVALKKPSEKLCAAGAPSDVSGDGPWTWTCADDAGHEVSCSTIRPMAGSCGASAARASAAEPADQLCESGAPSDVRMIDKTSWQWTCQGTMGAATASCSAPLKGAAASPSLSAPAISAPQKPKAESVCGAAAGQSFEEKPKSGLCDAGKAGAVRASAAGWSWTCGTKGKVNCEAHRTVIGVCGASNGAVLRDAPAESLCAAGTPTAVTGAGPWMWSCVGSGAGGSASCSASSQAQVKVDGLCGASAGGVSDSAPREGLCDSGVPSAVYGEGPWTWTCSGLNGGIASTCSTTKASALAARQPQGEAVGAVCGAANGVMMSQTPDKGDLCAAGMATSVSGNGPWNWSCIGANGGMTVSCTAPMTPPDPVVGMCGRANGVEALTAPRGALCASGIASAVSGNGPWTWSCSGTNGGGAVSCVAPVAGKNKGAARPLPSVVTTAGASAPAYRRDEAPVPQASPVGLVTPHLTDKVLPAHQKGALPNLKISGGKAAGAGLPDGVASAPAEAPRLPEGVEGLAPPVRDDAPPPAGLKPPVIDSEGKVVPGTRLILEADAATVSFERGSATLDADAVLTVEKLIKILKVYGDARITLVAYSDTDGSITPRDARKLSLNRALAIRDFMTTKGIASSRVDVRPMGANVPSGDMDRVDVKVN